MTTTEKSPFRDLVNRSAAIPEERNMKAPLHPSLPSLPPLLLNSLRQDGQYESVQNLGLWWERFGHSFAKLDPQSRNRRDGAVHHKFGVDREEWIRHLIRLAAGPAADIVQRERYADRLSALVEHGRPKGLSFNLKLTSRLLTGIGQPHPIENGLLFHPTLGCPYVPGSSIKGAVQAFVYEWLMEQCNADEKAEMRPTLDRIFGQPERLSGMANHADDTTRVGSVSFLDAIPVSPYAFSTEVITPHVGQYLIDPNYDTRLLEVGDPQPVHFPAIQEGAVFRFSLLPSRMAGLDIDKNAISSDIQLAGGWLVAALEIWGLGAKTKSGYGRFSSDTKQPEIKG